MPMTEDDFRSLLADKSHTPLDAGDQVSSVRRRIQQRQMRTRSSLVAAAAGVTAVAVFGVPSLFSGHRDNTATRESLNPSVTRSAQPTPPLTLPPAPTATPTPTVTPTVPDYTNGPPAFASGGKLLAGGVLRSPTNGALTITFTPTDWHLTFDDWCSPGWPSDTVSFLATNINGHDLGAGSCMGFGADTPGDMSGGSAEKALRDLGVELGKPSTFTVSIRQGPLTGRDFRPELAPLQAASQRPHATTTIGVYQHVPAADYPLPRVPDIPPTIAPVDTLGAARVEARTVGNNGTFALQVVAAAHNGDLIVKSVTPGQIRVLVNGTLVANVEFWDYTEAGVNVSIDRPALARFGIHVPDGQSLHITLEVSRFTGPSWAVYQQEVTR